MQEKSKIGDKMGLEPYQNKAHRPKIILKLSQPKFHAKSITEYLKKIFYGPFLKNFPMFIPFIEFPNFNEIKRNCNFVNLKILNY